MALDSSALAMRALLSATRRVHSSLDVDETLDTITQGVIEATVFDVAAVNILRADGSCQWVACAGPSEIRATLLGTVGPPEHWNSVMTNSRPWGELRFIHHSDPLATDDTVTTWRPPIEEPDDPDMWHPDDSLFAALTGSSGALLGTLWVDMPRDGRLPDEHQREILTLFAHHASVAIEHALLHAELQRSRDLHAHAADHDYLTGLYNRGVLYTRGFDLAAIRDRQLAVVMIDLDRFKELNDTAGHHAGDELLTIIARRMQSCLRDSDLLVRTGGDEFVVVSLIDAGLDADVIVAALVSRLTAAIEAPAQLGHGTHSVGASVGTATGETPADLDLLLIAADAAMYRVKDGRRRAARSAMLGEAIVSG